MLQAPNEKGQKGRQKFSDKSRINYRLILYNNGPNFRSKR